MGFAPEIPSTATLRTMHPLSDEGRQKVYEKRKETADALRFGHKLLAIIGPCAMTDDVDVILEENRQMAAFAEENNMVILHRLPPWKPRTNPADWHGLETTDPIAAHRVSTVIAEQNGNLAIEFGHSSHVQRYLSQAALGWRGSRNDGDIELLGALSASDTLLPLALKNGMSGQVEATLTTATRLSNEREAPTTLLFRGGEDFTTKQAWTTQLHEVLSTANGRVIVDAAHGGEQAHDPNQKFGKSILGQLACIQTITASARLSGVVPRGIMIEASNLSSPTDPVIPLEAALEALGELAAVHREFQTKGVGVAAD